MAQTLARVRVGMTREQARAITGAPDDVLTRLDPELQPTTIVTELWSFGADTHGAFPSVGSIGFDARGSVFSVHGASTSVVTAPAVPEAALRALFAKLAAVSGLNGFEFDPLPLVIAVNALVPLGKSLALDVIAEYLRVAPVWMSIDTQGIFLVLRALLAPPARAEHPRMLVGAPDVEQTAISASRFPSFPLAIVSDVPVMLVSGYILGGEAEPPESQLPWFRANGVLRAAPLAPAPLAFAQALSATRFSSLDNTPQANHSRRAMLFEQALRMVRQAYRATPVRGLEHFARGVDPAARWSAIVQEMTAQNLTWNAAGSFTSRQRSAPLSAARPRRVRHMYNAPGATVEVLLERLDEERARAWVHAPRGAAGGAFTGAIVTLLSAATPSTTLARVQLSRGAEGGYSSSEFMLPVTRSVLVRIERGAAATTSAALTP